MLLFPASGLSAHWQAGVLKHAQPYWKSAHENPWEVERQVSPPGYILWEIALKREQMFEAEAMRRVSQCLLSDMLVQVPKIHLYDSFNNIIIMEDCGMDVVNLRQFLTLANPISTNLAETIGSAIGLFVGHVHNWSRSNPGGILDLFGKNYHAKKTMADLNYDRLLSTLQGTDKDELPILDGFKVHKTDIKAIERIAGEYRDHLISERDPEDVVSSNWNLKALN